MAKDRAHLSIDQAKCAPCPELVCVGVCPRGILEPGTNKKPKITDENTCSLCGVCVDLCPTKAITITKQSSSSKK